MWPTLICICINLKCKESHRQCTLYNVKVLPAGSLASLMHWHLSCTAGHQSKSIRSGGDIGELQRVCTVQGNSAKVLKQPKHCWTCSLLHCAAYCIALCTKVHYCASQLLNALHCDVPKMQKCCRGRSSRAWVHCRRSFLQLLLHL